MNYKSRFPTSRQLQSSYDASYCLPNSLLPPGSVRSLQAVVGNTSSIWNWTVIPTVGLVGLTPATKNKKKYLYISKHIYCKEFMLFQMPHHSLII